MGKYKDSVNLFGQEYQTEFTTRKDESVRKALTLLNEFVAIMVRTKGMSKDANNIVEDVSSIVQKYKRLY